MGLNNERAERIVIDIETIGSPDAAEFLDPVAAPANYKDERKIAEYCAEKQAERVSKAGLEPDLCEIVAVGFWEYDRIDVLTRADHGEAELLAWLWLQLGGRPIIGFNTLGFDLPVLIRRSQLLDVPYPDLNLDRYRTPHVDLLQKLSFNGSQTFRSLNFYCRRFGLDVPADAVKGAEMPQLVADENWPAVKAHCFADVAKTVALARRLGWLPLAMDTLNQASGF